MNSKNPLVSVICICYNQADFILDAIQSVFDQTYPSIELIIVDDFSPDSSWAIIQEIKKNNPDIRILRNEKNLGNCRSFNAGFALSMGQFIIDLAADDILLPDRVRIGIEKFHKHGMEYGVHWGKQITIDSSGDIIDKKNPETPVFEGNLYPQLIEKYFVSPVTMMTRREVLVDMGGYDESLKYEDFDFWIRSSRNWKYLYTDDFLVKKRKVSNSHSTSQTQIFNTHQQSTLKVCRKILSINKNKAEDRALRNRVLYEMRQSLLSLNIHLIPSYLVLFFRTYRRLSSSSSMLR